MILFSLPSLLVRKIKLTSLLSLSLSLSPKKISLQRIQLVLFFSSLQRIIIVPFCFSPRSLGVSHFFLNSLSIQVTFLPSQKIFLVSPPLKLHNDSQMSFLICVFLPPSKMSCLFCLSLSFSNKSQLTISLSPSTILLVFSQPPKKSFSIFSPSVQKNYSYFPLLSLPTSIPVFSLSLFSSKIQIYFFNSLLLKFNYVFVPPHFQKVNQCWSPALFNDSSYLSL